MAPLIRVPLNAKRRFFYLSYKSIWHQFNFGPKLVAAESQHNYHFGIARNKIYVWQRRFILHSPGGSTGIFSSCPIPQGATGYGLSAHAQLTGMLSFISTWVFKQEAAFTSLRSLLLTPFLHLSKFRINIVSICTHISV
jgi:hypothetical protein